MPAMRAQTLVSTQALAETSLSESICHYSPAEIERLCEVMHDAYEAAAVGAGWETQQASRKPWADVPEANKATMRAAVSALLAALARHE
jgi:hypothetical protein